MLFCAIYRGISRLFIRRNKMRMRKIIGVIAAVTLLALCFCLTPATAENRDFNVKVMTQNMNPGAEIAAVAFADDPGTAIADTITDLFNSDIPHRAAIIAREIARTKPDIVALQEATRWEISTPSNVLIFDQLDQLMLALKKTGQHYKLAAVNPLTSVDVKVADFGLDPNLVGLKEVSYTDRDAVLVRSDLPSCQLQVLGSEARQYDQLMHFFAFGRDIPVERGWIALDMKANGARFKFVATHLDAAVAEEYRSIQEAQAKQLMQELKGIKIPVLLAGDFNSDAGHDEEDPGNYPLDSTGSYKQILHAGFFDAWDELRPWDDGFTWPLTVDSVTPLDPIERIDLVFSNGPQPISIDRIGVNPVRGLFASDHAGVVAEFNLLGRHMPSFGNKPFYPRPFIGPWHNYLHRRF
jgi:endonuclease/exonuclease/phosphatase family metal-dependent hydrolase